MRIIDSYWEEKNTGLRICEIIFDKSDNYQTYLLSDCEKDFDFIVVKVPVGNISLVHKLEDEGYRYLENQMEISFEINQIYEYDKKWERFLSGFTYDLVKEDIKLESVLKEVADRMFENDRFSLDPFWSDKISSIRYVNWIKDMYLKGDTQIYIMKKNEIDVGFFSLKQISENAACCPIAGIYNKYKSQGYFFPLTWFWFKESEQRGNKKLVATISANNKPIHSFLSRMFSFRIDETFIVMRKVINGSQII